MLPSRLTNLSDHLIRSHNISGKERKALLRRARFSVFSRQPEQSYSSEPQSNSTPGQCGYTVPETSSLPKQRKLPNPIPPNSASDENEDELILCPYDSRISYERVWGTNVPVMDYVFKFHHLCSMLVVLVLGKSEFVKQLLSLKCYIMTNPSERIAWSYSRHQSDLFRFLAQEIPCIEFYEELPTNIEVMFDRSKRNICIIDYLIQSASGNQLVENLFTNGRHLNLSVLFVSQQGRRNSRGTFWPISIFIYRKSRGGTHDIFGRGCATIKSLYRPFLEFLTKRLDPFRNFCA